MTLYYFLVDFLQIKSEFTRMNFDFTNLKLDFLRMNLFSFHSFENGFSTPAIHFPVYANRFPTRAIKFHDHANGFLTFFNHFPTYKIRYHITDI